MPELPEVETTRRGIAPWVVGQTLTDHEVHNSSLRWPVHLPSSLKGVRVDAVRRRGKYLLLITKLGTIVIHLGMSGSLSWAEPGQPRLTHDHVELHFGDKVLRLNDPRRFGCVLFHANSEPTDHPLLSHLGVEPLENEFNGFYLFERSRKRRVSIKNFIMDSKVVVGVGNIYAQEALFAAGMRPTVAAGRISRAGFDLLADAIRAVLSQAIVQGGTTLKDFVGSDGKPGYFQQYLYVYGRQGEPCRVCEATLKFVSIAQRSTAYCPQCQLASKFQSLRQRQTSAS